ncbi:MAG: hypothetical protein OXK16_03770 [bacterium]|nr:hypothetical protein [bacterium]
MASSFRLVTCRAWLILAVTDTYETGARDVYELLPGRTKPPLPLAMLATETARAFRKQAERAFNDAVASALEHSNDDETIQLLAERRRYWLDHLDMLIRMSVQNPPA